MFSRFYKYITEQNYFTTNDRLLLAISGGIDSMVLLHLMQQTGYNIAIAHFDHLTRNGQSTKDLEFVSSYCEQNNIEFYSETFNKNKAYKNFQDEAHKQRYDFFNSLGFDKIVTGHHKNDNTETILLHFLNGKSVHGIKNVNHNIVRPLLQFTKSEIEEYARHNNIEFVEDISNFKSDYDRNFLRNEVLPTLKRNFENIDYRVINLSQKIQARDNAFSRLSEKILQPKIENKYTSIGKASIINLDEISCEVLLQYLYRYNFNHTQVSDLVNNINNTGSLFHSQTHSIINDRDEIRIYNKPIGWTNIEFSLESDLDLYENEVFKFNVSKVDEIDTIINSKNTVFLSGDNIEAKLIVRPWQSGDFFYPLKMKGKKQSLKKYFANEKLDRLEKDLVPIFTTQSNDIIWIGNYRLDDRFKVTENTKTIYKISLLPK